MDITITITGSTNNPGNYNISGTTSLGVTTQLATNVTGNTQTGFSVTLYNVDSSTTGITVASTGTCSTTQTYTFIQPTPTPTPVYVNLNQLTIYSGSAGDILSGTACDHAHYANASFDFVVFSEFNQLTDGDTLYFDSLGGEIFVGNNYFYSDGSTYGQINNFGIYNQTGYCGY